MFNRSVLVDIATLVLLLGVYFLFAGEVSGTECIAAAIAVPATAGFILARRRMAGGRLAFTAPAAAFLHPLATLIPDTARVAGAFVLAIRFGPSGDRGAFTRQPPKAVGSKGIWILSQSLTPRNFVLGEADGTQILHGLTPRGDGA